MTFILKTYAITGKLVPVNGEHIEYDNMLTALAAAWPYAKQHGVQVVVKDFASDRDVAHVS